MLRASIRNNGGIGFITDFNVTSVASGSRSIFTHRSCTNTYSAIKYGPSPIRECRFYYGSLMPTGIKNMPLDTTRPNSFQYSYSTMSNSGNIVVGGRGGRTNKDLNKILHNTATRNYIFFETKNMYAQIKRILDNSLSKLGIQPTSLKHKDRMQKGRKIIIRLKANTEEQMKIQMIRMTKRVTKQMNRMNRTNTTRLTRIRKSFADRRHKFMASRQASRKKLKQWRKKKQDHISKYYANKRSIIQNRTQHIWKRILQRHYRKGELLSSMRHLMASMGRKWIIKDSRFLSNVKPNTNFNRITNIIKDRLKRVDADKYTKHTVTINEPFQREWFSDHGYPLTSKDPKTGRFVNPWKSESTNGWKRLEDVWKWKKTRMVGYDMKHSLDKSKREEESKMDDSGNILEVSPSSSDSSIPTQLAPPSSHDKVRLTWVGHATMLVQLSGFTILTDPVFSNKASPVQFFSETEFLGVPRRLPPSFTIDDIPDVGVDICLLSHDHYDHLDYDSVLQLTQKNLVKYWVVPLGMKDWLIREAGVIDKKIVELEWWQSVKFRNNGGHSTFSKDSNQIQLKEITKPFEWRPPMGDTSINAGSKSLVDGDKILNMKRQKNQDGNDLILTCAPAQHWCSRTPFDRNTRLWCSWAAHSSTTSSGKNVDDTPTNLSFFFAGDTGYPPSFPLHRQIGDYLGPFDLAAIPIGAYKPRFFMHDSHCDPYESVKIHQDVRSKRSIAIHWGTFPLANEPVDEPPELLKRAIHNELEKNGKRINFVSIPHGKSIESMGKSNNKEELDVQIG